MIIALDSAQRDWQSGLHTCTIEVAPGSAPGNESYLLSWEALCVCVVITAMEKYRQTSLGEADFMIIHTSVGAAQQSFFIR